jgi:hypothetical protein
MKYKSNGIYLICCIKRVNNCNIKIPQGDTYYFYQTVDIFHTVMQTLTFTYECRLFLIINPRR